MIGIPDERYGEVSLAAIILHEKETREWLEKENLLEPNNHGSHNINHTNHNHHNQNGLSHDFHSSPHYHPHRGKITQHITNYCRSLLSPYKIPTHFEYVKEFPMTVSGKVQKFILQKEMTKKHSK